ncbi:MAG: leucine-rich repeat protein [Bacilli bacterium]|nr:leucine-rich repeat protein [Bacilli bacterium]
MAKDILELGADVFDDTIVEDKKRISPKKRNYIIGLSISGALLAGIVTFVIVACNTFLLDLENVSNVTYIYTPTPNLAEGEEQTLTLYKLDSKIKYSSTFRVPSSVKGYKVTAIAPEAFVGHTEIKKVILPNTITTIGEKAFYGCNNLKSFSWSKNLIDVGNDAFLDTAFYTSLLNDDQSFYDLPSGVLIYVGNSYFAPNTALVSDLTFADEAMVNAIKTNYGVTTVKSFSELNVKKIASGALKNNQKIVYLDMPDSLTTICNNTFYNCQNLKAVDFSHSAITEIEQRAFYGCSSLEDITFYEGLETVGDEAFANTAITSIPELNNVKTIGSGVFKNCSQLVSAVVPASENFTKISDNMFNGCTSLNSITWGNEASDIDFINYIGNGAFANTGFTSFVLPKNVSIINEKTFENCANLEEVKIWGNPNYELMPVEDEEELDDEETPSFIDYQGTVRSGTPKGVSKIRNGAFNGCSSLTTISLYDDQNQPFDASYGNYQRKVGSFTFPVSLITTDDTTSVSGSNNKTFVDTKVTELVIPVNQTSIGSYAFQNVTSLQKVTIPSNAKLNKIAVSAFEGCTGLVSIALPKTLKIIASNAFSGCTNLTTIVMPEENISTIASYAFRNCSSLLKIDLPHSIDSIKNNAFEGCTSLEHIVIPSSINTINSKAFLKNRTEDATNKMPIFVEFTYEDFNNNVNLGSAWHDDTSSVYYLLADGEEKVDGIQYWHYVDGVPTIY